MKRIAKFHKVSFEQFKEGWIDTFGEAGESEIQKMQSEFGTYVRSLAGYVSATPM